ncbi:MAG: hypothetical protein ACIWVG_25960 [Gloeotrichia echinulata HAB0833]
MDTIRKIEEESGHKYSKIGEKKKLLFNQCSQKKNLSNGAANSFGTSLDFLYAIFRYLNISPSQLFL